MAKIPSYLKRSTAILKMPDAIERGLTASAFLKELQSANIGYRKQRFLADWRNVQGFETRKDTYKHIRKDRLPTQHFVVDVDWDMDKNYMYKFEVSTSRTEKDGLKPIHVNIVTDTLQPVLQVQAEVYNRWGDIEKYGEEPISKIRLIGIWHKVEGLEFPTPSPFIVEK